MRLYRIYREERLTERKRGGRNRKHSTRAPVLMDRSRNGASTSFSATPIAKSCNAAARTTFSRLMLRVRCKMRAPSSFSRAARRRLLVVFKFAT